jgi:hypothetical protein
METRSCRIAGYSVWSTKVNELNGEGRGTFGRSGHMTDFWHMTPTPALAVAACLGLVSCGERAVALEIALSCTAAADVAAAEADVVCREFAAALRTAHPDHSILSGNTGTPRIDLTVTGAGPRSVGLAVTFVAASGATTKGVPLRTSFFDRNADPTLRERFYQAFLTQNPLPF